MMFAVLMLDIRGTSAVDEHHIGQRFNNAKAIDAAINLGRQALTGTLVDQHRNLMRRTSQV